MDILEFGPDKWGMALSAIGFELYVRNAQEYERSRRNYLKYSPGILSAIVIACSPLVCGARPQASGYFTLPNDVAFAEKVGRGDINGMNDLLAKGVEVNTAGKCGMTFIVWSLIQQNREGFAFLLEHHANPNLQITDDISSVHGDAAELIKELITPGNSAMSLAAMHQDIWYLQEILKHGGDPNLVNPIRSQTPILSSIFSMRTANAKLLLSYGANPNWRNRMGNSVLATAAEVNHYDIVYAMLVDGADPKLENDYGNGLAYFIHRSRTNPKSEQGQWRQKVIDFLAAKGLPVESLIESGRRPPGPKPSLVSVGATYSDEHPEVKVVRVEQKFGTPQSDGFYGESIIFDVYYLSGSDTSLKMDIWRYCVWPNDQGGWRRF